MRVAWPLVARELRRAWGGGGAWWPVAFLLVVASLFPFALGPDRALLARVGGGVTWTAALLAALLPVDRLLAPDARAGVLDQLRVRGIAGEAVAAAKLLGHWLAFAPAAMGAALPAAALFGLDGATLVRLEGGLLIGTPGLAALGLLAAALTLRAGTGALAGLLVLPLAVPVLIFGVGTLAPGGVGAWKLLAAASLLLVALAPFAAGAALRGE